MERAIMQRVGSAIAFAILGTLAVGAPAAGAAEVFQLTSHQHGITGSPASAITQGSYFLSLTAGPSGAVLNETSSGGLGIDSNAVVGSGGELTTDRSRFNRISGGPLAGAGEFVEFSFGQPGVITGLLFDGLKDETFEYFRLDLPGGGALTIMDVEVELRLQEQGFTLAAIGLPNLTFLKDGNDDNLGLAIPFQAGEVFRMTYGEHPYPQGYAPRGGESPNGARWEGLIVAPEPATGGLVLVVAGMLCAVGRGRRARPR
jgi:hypothetical protein